MQNKIIDLYNSKKPIINGWLHLPNSFIAESFGKMGWDSITIDMQHGQNDYQSSIAILQALQNSTSSPLVRIPWNEPGIIMKMLDLGVLGIIAPMINNKKDCEEFVSYCYYPQKGQRSFGPLRAQLHYGKDYFENANNNILSFAMIETEEAINNIDEILSVPQLSGVYIGPADMSSSYGLKPKFDVEDKKILDNLEMIVKKTEKYKKISGIHNGSTKYAKRMIDMGFNLVTVLSDLRIMSDAAQNIVNEMKEIKLDNTKSNSY